MPNATSIRVITLLSLALCGLTACADTPGQDRYVAYEFYPSDQSRSARTTPEPALLSAGWAALSWAHSSAAGGRTAWRLASSAPSPAPSWGTRLKRVMKPRGMPILCVCFGQRN